MAEPFQNGGGTGGAGDDRGPRIEFIRQYYESRQGFGGPGVPPAGRRDGAAIAALVLGIVSIVFCIGCVGMIAGILGVSFSIRSLRMHRNKMAIAALVCSICGIVLSYTVAMMLLYYAPSLDLSRFMPASTTAPTPGGGTQPAEGGLTASLRGLASLLRP